MKKILFLLLFAGIFCQANAQIQLKKPEPKIQSCFTWYDAGAFGFAVTSGISHGIIEALRKDQGSLQKFLNVGDYEWGGRNDWERNYKGNRYRNENGSINPHKSELLGNFGRDAWHTAGDVAKWSDRFGSALFITGAAIDICRTSKLEYPNNSARKKAVRRKVWGYVAKGATLWAVSSLVETTTFQRVVYSR